MNNINFFNTKQGTRAKVLIPHYVGFKEFCVAVDWTQNISQLPVTRTRTYQTLRTLLAFAHFPYKPVDKDVEDLTVFLFPEFKNDSL